jgi:hypothetical protein
MDALVINQIANGHLLKENKEIARLLKSIKTKEERICALISQTQDKCNHVLLDNLLEDPNYIWGWHESRVKVLVSKTCTECGFVQKRPQKTPWQICYKCWSPMESLGFVAGEGGRTSVYRCTDPKCGHESYHT